MNGRTIVAAILSVAASLGVRAQNAPPSRSAEHHEFVIDNFRTESGVTLPKARIVYGTYGRLNAARDNVVLLPSHYMANHHGYDWLIGPDRALDPRKAVPGRHRAVRQRPLLVAEQHARAVSRTALPGDDHPRQRRSGPSAARRRAEGDARARDHRLLDGRRAGVPVGGQPSRRSPIASSPPRAPRRRGRTASCGSKGRSPR